MSLSRRRTAALDWSGLRATCAPPLHSIPATAGRSVPPARSLFAAFAAAYLAVVAVALPVAKTREALDLGLFAPPPAADVNSVGHGHPPHGNPDSDFSDAIPVKGLFVFSSPLPVLGVPVSTPGVLLGEADAPRPRLLRTRDDFERGPPSLT
jgi:hypothetical protein